MHKEEQNKAYQLMQEGITRLVEDFEKATKGDFYGADYQKTRVSYEAVCNLISFCTAAAGVLQAQQGEIERLNKYIDEKENGHIVKKGIGRAK